MILSEASRENLAAEVAVHLGREAAGGGADPATVALARGHVETVAAYAHAYTFGRGFTVDVDGNGEPAHDVARVIVAAAARLTTNPEQVSVYSAGDYSERPAVFTGWTIAEQGVLHRWRKRWA